MNNPQPWWLTMPPAELAATILPLFPSSCRHEGGVKNGIVNWCKTGQYREPRLSMKRSWEDPDLFAISEAIQVLEHAGLLIRFLESNANSRLSWFNIGLTRLGMYALQTNTVRQHLGLGDTPPPSE
jgi:hypothetical protein